MMDATLTYAPGQYRGRVTKWNLGKASTGNPQFSLTFMVVCAYDEAGNPVTCSEYERTLYRTITDKTVDYVVRDLQSLGYDCESFAYLNPELPGAYDFSGKEIEVRCKHEQYQGKMKERWELAFGGDAQPLEDAEVKKLDALFGRKLKKPGSTKPVAPARQPAKATANVAAEVDPITGEPDNDIPF